MSVLEKIEKGRKSGIKMLAVLIDPDTDFVIIERLLNKVAESKVDFIFVGGSLLYKGRIEECLEFVKQRSSLPVVIFPGSEIQISETADAILFLSLISGRNPDLLIGKHITVAPFLEKMDIEVVPTGYILIDGGKQTTASYISQTIPIPSDKPGIAMATAMAGQLLGLKLIYLDAGSGALQAVSPEIIEAISSKMRIPVVVGGGIKNRQQIESAWSAGADIVVIGNMLESNPDELDKIST